MSTTYTGGVSIIAIVVLLLIYRFVFNPQVVIAGSRRGGDTCPAGWTYEGGLCVPGYNTNCAPFDPSKITSQVEACNLARTCGADWPGVCP